MKISTVVELLAFFGLLAYAAAKAVGMLFTIIVKGFYSFVLKRLQF